MMASKEKDKVQVFNFAKELAASVDELLSRWMLFQIDLYRGYIFDGEGRLIITRHAP
jgi:hypothetical protein